MSNMFNNSIFNSSNISNWNINKEVNLQGFNIHIKTFNDFIKFKYLINLSILNKFISK